VHARHILAWRGTNVYGDLVKLLAFMNWVHFFFHNNFSLLITNSKVELQKSLKWSYIYLCLASHHYLLYFVRWVHWCQVWRISAAQLFNTVNGELVSCLGRKNRASQLNQHHRCLPLGSKLFQGIATMTYTRSHTRPSQKDLGCVVYPTEYTELQPLLSGVHSVMRVKSVLAGEGGGCTPTPSHYIYPHQ
jgi:hypothetical protein